MTQIRKRRIIEWHDDRVRDKGEVRFVRFPFRLWKTEFELRERLVPRSPSSTPVFSGDVCTNGFVWELDVQVSKKGKITDTGKKQVRPIEVWFRSEDDFADHPSLAFSQIDPAWIEREKEILANV